MRMAKEFEMFNFLKFKKFCENEDGAVAVDWVVLSAAIIGLAVSAVTSTQNATVAAANSISGKMSAMNVPQP